MPEPVGNRPKPRDDQIDVFGLTHPGKVRKENQDHFLVCQLRKEIQVHLTSLPEEEIAGTSERLAFLAMVADGVGGRRGGEAASRMALSAVTRYVSESIETYYGADARDDDSFRGELHASALRVHEHLLAAGESDPARSGMATTLTLFIGVWPYIYLLQVGDSRYYLMRDEQLVRGTRDQTVGQQLVDEGVLEDRQAEKLDWAGALSSSIGGHESAPVVTRLESLWGDVHLVCTDGLTKHVSDEQIRDRLLSMTSAKQACEQLLQDALDGGGSDNISIIVGRTVIPD